MPQKTSKKLKKCLTNKTEYGIIKVSKGTKKKIQMEKGEMNYGKEKDSERILCRD